MCDCSAPPPFWRSQYVFRGFLLLVSDQHTSVSTSCAFTPQVASLPLAADPSFSVLYCVAFPHLAEERPARHLWALGQVRLCPRRFIGVSSNMVIGTMGGSVGRPVNRRSPSLRLIDALFFHASFGRRATVVFSGAGRPWRDSIVSCRRSGVMEEGRTLALIVVNRFSRRYSIGRSYFVSLRGVKP